MAASGRGGGGRSGGRASVAKRTQKEKLPF